MDSTSRRFDYVSDAELLSIVNSSSSKKTEYANRHVTKLFNNYLSTMTNLNKSMETISKEDLISVLPKFYAGLKTEKGEGYSAVSLLSIRSSLNRSISAYHFPCFNLITDPAFQSANRVFKAILKKNAGSRKGSNST